MLLLFRMKANYRPSQKLDDERNGFVLSGARTSTKREQIDSEKVHLSSASIPNDAHNYPAQAVDLYYSISSSLRLSLLSFPESQRATLFSSQLETIHQKMKKNKTMTSFFPVLFGNLFLRICRHCLWGRLKDPNKRACRSVSTGDNGGLLRTQSRDEGERRMIQSLMAWDVDTGCTLPKFRFV